MKGSFFVKGLEMDVTRSRIMNMVTTHTQINTCAAVILNCKMLFNQRKEHKLFIFRCNNNNNKPTTTTTTTTTTTSKPNEASMVQFSVLSLSTVLTTILIL